MKNIFRKILVISVLLVAVGCSSIITKDEFYKPLIYDLKYSDYKNAAVKISDSSFVKNYDKKDLLLYHLDKGIIYHYAGQYELSNLSFDKAEDLIDELYTKSISKGAMSILLNDNALDYCGEVYENLYLNIFKTLNYIHLKKYDEAYIECKKVNEKLSELDNKYGEYTNALISSGESKIKINPRELDYYNNVLANYLSYLIFNSEGETDNARISKENLLKAWETHSDVYNYNMPEFIDDSLNERSSKVVIIAFLGNAPVKQAVGARITTFDDFIMISDPTNFHADAIPFPGSKIGYNFKFEFPQLIEEGSEVKEVKVYVDSVYYGKLHLLENMANVARKTFESNKSVIFFKTIIRAVSKGIGANALADKLKKGSNEFLGDIISLLTNAAVDATEHADLRSWKTMPAYCLVSEVKLPKGNHNIRIEFVNSKYEVIRIAEYKNYSVGAGLNLIEDYLLN